MNTTRDSGKYPKLGLKKYIFLCFLDIRAVADVFLCKCIYSVCKSVAEAGNSGPGSVFSRVADVGAQQGFLRQRNARAEERPISSRKRHWQGLGQNCSHQRTYTKHPREHNNQGMALQFVQQKGISGRVSSPYQLKG